MAFRYIGSKARLVDSLREHIGPWKDGTFFDAFCGTGAVAELASSLGWPVLLNDHLLSSATMAAARLARSENAQFTKLGSYEKTILSLNALDPIEGFIWREYSPASRRHCGIERRYFTEANAGRIDAARQQIAMCSKEGLLSTDEEQLILTDLLGAVNRCANIAGTYECFLAKWTAQSANAFLLQARPLASDVKLSVRDVFELTPAESDVVYLDPPYTKRQYAAYYHILETVVIGDEPTVEGVAGLCPWKDRSSVFCYKIKVLNVLVRLIEGFNARRILLPYSKQRRPI
ncbi:ulcer associated adenine specific DNA methyltransferase [Candidatus Burkholderia brachyanthoides]|nr:ulcer associated adenine specific DNA methyltransferase [Candidatus Burkholderia brachyanthoides]